MSSPPELAELLYWVRALLYSWSLPFISSTDMVSGRGEEEHTHMMGRAGVWTHGWMDGWIDRWMDGWMGDGWVIGGGVDVGWMDGWIEGW